MDIEYHEKKNNIGRNEDIKKRAITKSVFFQITILLFNVYGHFDCIFVQHMHSLPVEIRREYHIPWNCSYEPL